MLSHLLPSLSTILYCCILFYVHYCPLLPTIADYCLLLPTIAYYCLLLHTIVYCILVTNPLLSGYLVLSHLLPSLSTILYYCILFYVHFCLLLHTIVFYCGDQPPPLRLPSALPPLAFIIPSSLVLPASLIKIYSITSLAAFWLDVWIAMLVCLLLPEKRKHVSHSNWSYLRHTRSCHQTKLSSAPSQLVSAGPSFVSFPTTTTLSYKAFNFASIFKPTVWAPNLENLIFRFVAF